MNLRRLVSAAAIIVCSVLVAQAAAFAGPTAIGSCGKTLSKSGSYALSGNLTAKKMGEQACIDVSANFVTIRASRSIAPRSKVTVSTEARASTASSCATE